MREIISHVGPPPWTSKFCENRFSEKKVWAPEGATVRIIHWYFRKFEVQIWTVFNIQVELECSCVHHLAAEESTFWAVNLTSKNSEVMSAWDLERSNLGGRDLEAGPSDTFEPFMITSNRPPDYHFKVPQGLV